MNYYGPWYINKCKNKFYLRREILPRAANRKIKWQSYDGQYDSGDFDVVQALRQKLNADRLPTPRREPVRKPKIEQLLYLDEVLALLKFSRTTLYKEIVKGRFPKPLKWAGKAIWFRPDVDDYFERKLGFK